MSEKTNSSKEFLKKNRLKLAFGALAVGTVVSIPSFGDHTDEILEKAPIVAGSIVASEALFIGGVAMVMASQRNKIMTKDIFSKEYFKNEVVGKPIEDNKLLRSGLIVNTVGALGTGVALGYGALATLPGPMIPSAVTLAGIDIAATVAIRYNIFKGINESHQQIEELAGK